MEEREWTQEDIDDEVASYSDSEDCDCIEYDVDILEGRAHCFVCGRSWYLTGDQLRAELKCSAERDELIADEQSAQEKDR
jgi:hypothetical protein